MSAEAQDPAEPERRLVGSTPAPGSDDAVLALLTEGDLRMEGQVPWSSNYTFLASVTRGAESALVIYKPSQGERELWDFDAGTLCQRELAAYRVARFLGWPNVPPVALRDGPFGHGSAQLFIEADLNEHYFTLRENPAFTGAFGRMALFDHLTNNADRKGGHVLRGADERIWAIDHGLTFHVEHKHRTVIWEYAGQAIPSALRADLERLLAALLEPGEDEGGLWWQLAPLLHSDEIEALAARARRLLRLGRYPMPARNWRNVPYPLI